MVTIQMRKFGTILNSRPAGREAALRVKQIVNGASGDISLDFSKVDLLTPSFADEFIQGVKRLYQDKKVEPTGFSENKVIEDTLKVVRALD